MKQHALLLLALLAGCGQSIWGLNAETTSEWYETGPVRKSKEDVARTVRELILRQGYQTPEFDPADRLETGWETRLATRWREGFRTKLEAEILPAEAGGFNVRVRCTMEVNDNSTQPHRFPAETTPEDLFAHRHVPRICCTVTKFLDAEAGYTDMTLPCGSPDQS